MGILLHLACVKSIARLLVDSAVYVSLAVAGLGLATCELAGLPVGYCLPVWLLGTYLLYSLHKVVIGRIRRGFVSKVQLVATTGALVMLLMLSVQKGDWILSSGVMVALAAGLAYSYHVLPVVGGPLRNLPVLKSILPWVVSTAAVTVLPLHQAEWQVAGLQKVGAAWAWAACILLANILWCDLRDSTSDLQHGVLSLPGLLGRERVRLILSLLSPSAFVFGMIAAGAPSQIAVAAAGAAGVAVLAATDPSALERTNTELLAEGTLLLPALPVLLAWLVRMA